MFAARTAAEIRARQNHRSTFITRRVQNKFRVRLFPRQIAPIVKKHAPITLPRLQFQKLFWHHLIGIHVHAIQRRHESRMLDERFHRHSAPSTLFHLRMSTKWPSIAAAAAITGLTRCVRPPLPCRPSKLRLEVLAERSPLCSTSSFIPMHMLHPASRHSNPAATKTLSSPSASASAFTTREPGTTSACFKDFDTCFPATTFAAARKSSSREFVHDPMNTRSSEISSIAVPGFKSIYTSARVAASRSTGSLKDAGSGTRSETCVTIPGFVPQVTIGASSLARIVKVSSYFASASVGSVFQKATRSSNSFPRGTNARPSRYLNVVSSGATMPARAPPSIDILHIVMRPSIESPRTASPVYSKTYPVPPAIPIVPITARIMSFAVTPRGRLP